MGLADKHRPMDWGEVVGQGQAVRQIKTAGRGGFGGKAFWLAGQSGTGKTTLARLIASEEEGGR